MRLCWLVLSFGRCRDIRLLWLSRLSIGWIRRRFWWLFWLCWLIIIDGINRVYWSFINWLGFSGIICLYWFFFWLGFRSWGLVCLICCSSWLIINRPDWFFWFIICFRRVCIDGINWRILIYCWFFWFFVNWICRIFLFLSSIYYLIIRVGRGGFIGFFCLFYNSIRFTINWFWRSLFLLRRGLFLVGFGRINLLFWCLLFIFVRLSIIVVRDLSNFLLSFRCCILWFGWRLNRFFWLLCCIIGIRRSLFSLFWIFRGLRICRIWFLFLRLCSIYLFIWAWCGFLQNFSWVLIGFFRLLLFSSLVCTDWIWGLFLWFLKCIGLWFNRFRLLFNCVIIYIWIISIYNWLCICRTIGRLLSLFFDRLGRLTCNVVWVCHLWF